MFFVIYILLILENMKKSISEKEMGIVSRLELKGKYFFTRQNIENSFKSSNEMNVYLCRMKKKGRIAKLNKSKYFLIPVKAIGSKWTEHPFILIDEMMDSKDYCIVGKAAAYYWKLTDQIPYEYEVYNTKRHGIEQILNVRIDFRKRRNANIPKPVNRKIQGHSFMIEPKKEAAKWL